MNWSSLPYRQRTKYLIGACLFFLFVAYQLSIKKTIAVYRENVELKQSVENGEGVGDGLTVTEQKLADLNSYLEAYTLDSLKTQQFIMSELSNLCRVYNLTLKHFPKATSVSENDFSIETNTIEITGSFTNLLKLIYALETKHKIGRVSSASFKSYIDVKSKRTILSLIIHLQNVRNNADKG